MTKLKSKVIVAVVVMCLIIGAFPTKTHANETVAVSPYWTALATHGSANVINGNTGRISITGDTYTSAYTIKLSATLQRMSQNSGGWNNYMSWSATGTKGLVSIGENYTATSGYVYRAVYTLRVYKGTTLIETINGVTNTSVR